MRGPVIAVALLASSGCALISGLSTLDVDDGRDASTLDANVQNVDAAVEADAKVPPSDSGSRDATSELGPNDLICGPTLTCAFPSQACCFGDAGTCYASDGGVCSGTPVVCDYTGQCPTGQVCCATLEQTKPKGSSCKSAANCTAPTGYRLCRLDSECAGSGKCITVPTFNGYSYCQ
jgi:hypothetical protein